MIATVLALGCAGPASATWEQPVGGASPINESANGYSESQDLIAINGVPYVAWDEWDGSTAKIRVARLNAPGTAWEKVGETLNPVAPINQSASRQAYNASLGAINGVPYVAWDEQDSVSSKIRVARLNTDGTGWDKVGQTLNPSGLNYSVGRAAHSPSLTVIDGVPYVAWSEEDTVNNEIRVARLNAAGTGWDKVGQTLNSASPINQSATGNANDPSLTSIAGVPYVAWSEDDGSNYEIRVARLNAAGTGWEKLPNASSPINQSNGSNAEDPSLTVIEGVPYVAWSEEDGTNSEIRVARLNAAGTGWEKVGQADSPASPINASPAFDGERPSLTSINGVPYVSWSEDIAGIAASEIRVARLNASGTGWERVADSASPINEVPGEYVYSSSIAPINGVPFVAWGEDDDSQAETRVARLEPVLTGQSTRVTDTTATLGATWFTYGLPYPLGFEYGANLEQSTTPTDAPVGQDTVTVDQQVQGLAATSTYSFRPFAIAGLAEPRVLGDLDSFTTAPTPPDTTPPETTITKEPKNKLDKSKAKYKFTSSEPNSTFKCKFDRKKPKPCDAGKAKYKRLDDGKHKFKVVATDAAGNSDPSAAKDKFKVL